MGRRELSYGDYSWYMKLTSFVSFWKFTKNWRFLKFYMWNNWIPPEKSMLVKCLSKNFSLTYIGESINIQFHTYSLTYYFANIGTSSFVNNNNWVRTCLCDLSKRCSNYQSITNITPKIRNAVSLISNKCFGETKPGIPHYLYEVSNKKSQENSLTVVFRSSKSNIL